MRRQTERVVHIARHYVIALRVVHVQVEVFRRVQRPLEVPRGVLRELDAHHWGGKRRGVVVFVQHCEHYKKSSIQLRFTIFCELWLTAFCS